MRPRMSICAAGALLTFSTLAFSQTPAAAPQPGRGANAGRGPQAPAVLSPEVTADRHVSFRIYAPQAQAVRLSAGDIGGLTPAASAMTKAENGVWAVTVGPVDPGAYRYVFSVDGVNVMDPRNPAVSESNANSWSLVVVPGSPLFDTQDVPHGSVSAVAYYSKSLKKFRRLHVYTPPGYETSTQKYPIFYLLHGAGDCDDSWTSVGRAGFIMDNLIAAKKAKPMVIVMPAGHTSQAGLGAPRPPAAAGAPPATPNFEDEFVGDFNGDIMPFVEARYRVLTDRSNRAIAGLSMGGNQTLNIAIPNLAKFAYIGVYSSGLLTAFGAGRGAGAPAPAPGPNPWEVKYAEQLDNAQLKKGLKLFWFATGSQDFLINTTKSSVDLFKKHGFNVVFKETDGGHTWINWRNYLNDFAPMLFK